jgi:hypothetical protein
MHDSRHIHLLGALSDQLLGEYGDAMHAAVNNKPLRVNPAKTTAKAAPAPTAVAKQKKLTAKPRGKGFFSWLFGAA